MSGILKSIGKIFKKIIKSPIFKAVLIAVAIYFTAGLALGAMGAAFATTLPGIAGAAEGLGITAGAFGSAAATGTAAFEAAGVAATSMEALLPAAEGSAALAETAGATAARGEAAGVAGAAAGDAAATGIVGEGLAAGAGDAATAAMGDAAGTAAGTAAGDAAAAGAAAVPDAAAGVTGEAAGAAGDAAGSSLSPLTDAATGQVAGDAGGAAADSAAALDSAGTGVESAASTAVPGTSGSTVPFNAQPTFGPAGGAPTSGGFGSTSPFGVPAENLGGLAQTSTGVAQAPASGLQAWWSNLSPATQKAAWTGLSDGAKAVLGAASQKANLDAVEKQRAQDRADIIRRGGVPDLTASYRGNYKTPGIINSATKGG